MSEIEHLRRIMDARIRPAHAGAATVADRRAAAASAPRGRPRLLSRYDHHTGQTVTYGRYGRTRYDTCHYSGA
mgnify:CR=1 FL=1|jgi:hypothetical protein